jgi:YD repeat-containing protein
MKSILAGLVVFLGLQCLLGRGAAAQTSPTCITWVNCGWTSFSSGCQPPVPAGATNCSLEGPWSLNCEVVSNNCGTPLVWCPTCGKYVASGGSPINLTNGNTYIQETDLRIPGLGNSLTLTRTWNSIWPASESAFQSGMFGLNWRSNYEERVFQGSGNAVNYMAYLRADGGLWYFGPNNGSTWPLAAPANTPAALTQNGTQSWTITFQNGEQRVFNYTSGSLTAIIDRNGNTTQLSYDSINRLVTVTDPASRHLYFAYGNNSSLLVTSITSDIGVSLSYSYDSQGRLTLATEPDQSTFSFQYNSQSLISTVTDSNGVILESHTYDGSGRGLTSSQVNGVNAVTISYANQ